MQSRVPLRGAECIFSVLDRSRVVEEQAYETYAYI